MKVEFWVNQPLEDGRQIVISASEFKKGKNNEEEYHSFAFATNCFFAYYGFNDLFIMKEGYDKILESLNKYDAVVLIAVVEDNDLIPVVYYSTNHHLTPAGTALDDFLGSTHNL